MVGMAMTGFERDNLSVRVNDCQMTALNEAEPLFKAAEARFSLLILARGG